MPIPSAREASDATVAGDTSAAFEKIVGDAINVSVAAKTKTATISFSGKDASDVMNYRSELKRKGYNVSQASTNLTITW